MTAKTTKKDKTPAKAAGSRSRAKAKSSVKTPSKTSSKTVGKTRKAARKSGRKTPRKGFFRGGRLILWTSVATMVLAITAFTLVWALHLNPTDKIQSLTAEDASGKSSSKASVTSSSPGSGAKQLQTDKPAASPPSNHIRAKVQAPAPASTNRSSASGRVYEIYDAKLLEQQIKEVDLALVQTIMDIGLDPQDVRHLDIQMETRKGQKYHTQSLSIGLGRDADSFIASLRKNLDMWIDGAALRFEGRDPRKEEWQISLMNLPTHTLFLEPNSQKTASVRPAEPQKPTPPVRSPHGPRLVVVIDDLGESVQQARALAALSFPVTFAILPHSSKTRQVAQLALKAGRDVLLHLPMEPLDYPHRADPGPGALFVGMEDTEILARLEDNLAQIPQAIGVNNHMGSRFTADRAGMATVLGALKGKDMFFLDSLTTGKSVVQEQARKIGLTNLRRQIFLDNVQNVQAILFQLRKAERLAHSTGDVIAIGHPYPETLEALRIWEKERDPDIDVVALNTVLPRSALAAR